ncbi:efflux RND transporter periplasmic adaptor subunit [uncultured Sphingomonas sp.]|uniref:efflux RND transporter periplasmic adaptor subunit n=1 Tax=uncultured Sphingomonas sp. TaxID=158754 RepID=UPI0035CBE3CF
MNYETRDVSGQFALAGEDAPSRRRWWIIGGLVLLVLVLIAAGMMMRGGQQAAAVAPDAAAQLPSVTVASPGSDVVARTLSATGSLAARREMPIGVAGEGGRVTRVLVEPGTWVAAGQVLATVDRSVQTQTAASLAAQINVARSDAQIAQSEYDRSKTLVGRGFISKADLERKGATLGAANARVKVAQAQLAEAQARNGRLDIRAPEAGLVLTRNVEPGQIVSSGSGVLFRMARGGELEMRAELGEGDLANIRVGTRADVTPVGSDRSFTGEIWQVSPVIDPVTRRGIVRIALKYDPALRPGGFASASVYGGSSRAPQLPNSAIQTDVAGNFVYIVGPDDKVQRRSVRTGEVSDRGVAIVEGLEGTERVVVSAGAFLNPGQKIKPIPGKL